MELDLPGLYNVYNAAAAPRCSTRRSARRSPTSATGSSDSAQRSGASSASPPAAKSVVLLLVKNPAGANEVVRTLETGVPPVLVIALNDAIADGQDVSWIWDVDFEPLLEHAELVDRERGARGRARAAACLRRSRGGSRSR